MPEWKLMHSNMCSMTNNAEAVRKHYEWCKSCYNASEDDCELLELQDAPTWEQKIGVKVHWKFLMKTYRGYKVYSLMTGCLSSLPEYEPLDKE